MELIAKDTECQRALRLLQDERDAEIECGDCDARELALLQRDLNNATYVVRCRVLWFLLNEQNRRDKVDSGYR